MRRQTSPGELAESRDAFQRALLGWYRAQARPLPWRTDPSPYKTVVSEFMLQQTQVKTVLPYFQRWLERFPDFQALAQAPEAAVLKLWEGLGYYARARNLHRLAKTVALLPTLPRTTAEWGELPGIGPYTAAAVSSIAFGAPAACVDGNVVRILTRLVADGRSFRDRGAAAKALAPLGQQLLTVAAPGDHNQAMMELGATVCIRSNPLCLSCPVRSFCRGYASGRPEDFPRLTPKTIEHRHVVRVWCERNEAVLLHRAPDNARRFAGLHEVPTPEQLGLDAAQLATGQPLLRKRRGITRYQITETFYAAVAPSGAVPADLVWVPLDQLEQVTLSGPHRRWTNEILAARAAGGRRCHRARPTRTGPNPD